MASTTSVTPAALSACKRKGCSLGACFWDRSAGAPHARAVTYLNLVHNHGLVAELHQRLGHCQSERPQPRAIATDQNEGLHGAEMEEGLREEVVEEEAVAAKVI